MPDHKFKEKDAIHIFKKLCSACRMLYDKHTLLHRNLKPENIIFNEKHEPLLVDYGVYDILEKFMN